MAKNIDITNINAGLDIVKELAAENSKIARDEVVPIELIDLAENNSYAANDDEDNISDLADQIAEVGLLNPLGVVVRDGRYRLFSGERRLKAIKSIGWTEVPCRVYEGVSAGRAQLMLHMANGARNYSPEQKLALAAEYEALLKELQESGEFSGSITRGIAELIGVKPRMARNYRAINRELSKEEIKSVAEGKITVVQAAAKANERTEKKNSGNIAAPAESLTPTEAVILSGEIYNLKKLKSYYMTYAPTPQEAIAEKLRIEGIEHKPVKLDDGSVIRVTINGGMELESKDGQCSIETMQNIDMTIRRLYRAGRL